MANKKITDLVEITSAANVDVLPIVDVSADVTNKIKVENLPINTATQTALDAKQATLVSGTNIKTINSTSLLGSGDIAIAANPAGTAGQIQFSDGSAFAADSNLYWDNTNKRLGVGTATPNVPFEVYAASPTIATRIVSNGMAKFAFLSGNSAEMGSLSITGSSGESRWETKTSFFPTIYSSGQEVVRINTSRQMGIGTTSPTARLQVKGSGSTSATTSLLVQNSAGTDLLKVADNGQLNVGGSVSRINSDSNDLLVTSGNMRFSGVANFGLGNYPSTSAVLQADSTTKGFLPPRMTTTQKNAISTPAAGLVVYDTDTNKLCCYNGTSWNDLF